jgi:hypothetical protein
MKCDSCEIEINPQWTHAIEINVCPYCGKSIMAEHLKNLLSTLRETMNQLQPYSDQLNDWMLANHQYIKTTADLTPYLPKDYLKNIKPQKSEPQKTIIKTENGEEVEVEKIQTNEETNAFFRRAEAIKKTNPQSISEKTRKLKEMADQIKKAGSVGVSDDGNLLITAEMMDNADPEAIAEYEQLATGNEIMSSMDNQSSDDNDIPIHILSQMSKGKSNNNTSANDLIKLQQMQERAKHSKSNFGGGGGSFSRG